MIKHKYKYSEIINKIIDCVLIIHRTNHNNHINNKNHRSDNMREDYKYMRKFLPAHRIKNYGWLFTELLTDEDGRIIKRN